MDLKQYNKIIMEQAIIAVEHSSNECDLDDLEARQDYSSDQLHSNGLELEICDIKYYDFIMSNSENKDMFLENNDYKNKQDALDDYLTEDEYKDSVINTAIVYDIKDIVHDLLFGTK